MKKQQDHNDIALEDKDEKNDSDTDSKDNQQSLQSRNLRILYCLYMFLCTGSLMVLSLYAYALYPSISGDSSANQPFKYLIANWQQNVITDIQIAQSAQSCPNGIKPGCDCTTVSQFSQAFTSGCDQNKLSFGCKNVNQINPQDLINWKDNSNSTITICAKRLQNYNFINLKSSCDSNERLCGGTNAELKFCIPSSSPCPINFISLTKPTGVSQLQTISIDSNAYLYYSSSTENYPISEIRVSQSSGVCKFNNNSYTNPFQIKSILDSSPDQLCQNYDNNFISIQQIDQVSFYAANNIFTILSTLPSADNLFSSVYKFGLFYKSYSSFQSTCRQYIGQVVTQSTILNTIYSWELALMIFNVIHFVIVWIILGLYYMFKKNKKQGYNWSILMINALMTVGQGIVCCTSYGYIASFYSFLNTMINNGCGDQMTQSMWGYYYKLLESPPIYQLNLSIFIIYILHFAVQFWIFFFQCLQKTKKQDQQDAVSEKEPVNETSNNKPLNQIELSNLQQFGQNNPQQIQFNTQQPLNTQITDMSQSQYYSQQQQQKLQLQQQLQLQLQQQQQQYQQNQLLLQQTPTQNQNQQKIIQNPNNQIVSGQQFSDSNGSEALNFKLTLNPQQYMQNFASFGSDQMIVQQFQTNFLSEKQQQQQQLQQPPQQLLNQQIQTKNFNSNNEPKTPKMPSQNEMFQSNNSNYQLPILYNNPQKVQNSENQNKKQLNLLMNRRKSQNLQKEDLPNSENNQNQEVQVKLKSPMAAQQIQQQQQFQQFQQKKDLMTIQEQNENQISQRHLQQKQFQQQNVLQNSVNAQNLNNNTHSSYNNLNNQQVLQQNQNSILQQNQNSILQSNQNSILQSNQNSINQAEINQKNNQQISLQKSIPNQNQQQQVELNIQSAHIQNANLQQQILQQNNQQIKQEKPNLQIQTNLSPSNSQLGKLTVSQYTPPSKLQQNIIINNNDSNLKNSQTYNPTQFQIQQPSINQKTHNDQVQFKLSSPVNQVQINKIQFEDQNQFIINKNNNNQNSLNQHNQVKDLSGQLFYQEDQPLSSIRDQLPQYGIQKKQNFYEEEDEEFELPRYGD